MGCFTKITLLRIDMEDFGSRDPGDLVKGSIQINAFSLVFNLFSFFGLFGEIAYNLQFALILMDVIMLTISLYIYITHFRILKSIIIRFYKKCIAPFKVK